MIFIIMYDSDDKYRIVTSFNSESAFIEHMKKYSDNSPFQGMLIFRATEVNVDILKTVIVKISDKMQRVALGANPDANYETSK